MKRQSSLLLMGGVLVLLGQISDAQPRTELSNPTEAANAANTELARATQTARAEIQAANDDFNAALLRGDAPGALKWLAPDFEMGRYQYRVRDLNWAKRALPLQLEQTRFSKLETRVGAVEWNGKEAIARGHIEARAVFKDGSNQPSHYSSLSGDGTAVWTQTPQGWRLRRDNGVFATLSQLVAPAAPVVAPDPRTEKPHPSGLTRENPAVVLPQTNNWGRSVNAVAFSPDGATLATSTDDAILLALAQSGAPTGEIKTPAHIWGLAYAPDGSVFSAHNDGKVRQWNAATSAPMQTFALGDKYNVTGLTVAPDGKTLAASNANAFQLWDVASARRLRTYPAGIAVTEFSPDGKRVALQHPQSVEIRRVSDDALVARYPNESWGGFGGGGAVVITKRNHKLSFRVSDKASVEREIEVFDPVRRARESANKNRHFGIGAGFIWESSPLTSPDGTLLVQRFEDGTLGVFDARTGQLNRVLRGFNGEVLGGEISTMAFARDSTRLAVGSRGGETAIWELSAPARKSQPLTSERDKGERFESV